MTGKTLVAIVATLSLLLSLFAIVSPVMADHQPPDGPAVMAQPQNFPGGDPICPAGSTGVRYNAPGASGGSTITLADGSQATISFTIADDRLTFVVTGGLAAQVFVKGGTDGQNLYDYTGLPGGGIAHDDGLITPTTQGISHIDFCVVPVEASIIVYKTDQLGNDVAGAMFEVWDGDMKVAGPTATGADGLVCFGDLVLGHSYSVVETDAPDGWLPADPDTQTVIAAAGTCAERTGDDPDATFTNVRVGSLIVLKTDDQDPATALPGAVFTVNGVDQTTGADGTTCFDGLVAGDAYDVTEKTPPAGYEPADPATQEDIIAGEGTCTDRAGDPADVTFTNAEIEELGSITINKEIDCLECETRTPGFWFNTAGSHDEETNALLAELAAMDGGSNAGLVEIDIDGTVETFATAQDVRDFIAADRDGADGEEGLSRDGALLRHYLATWLNVLLNGDECDLLARELNDQSVESILMEAAAALAADDEAAEVIALEKLTAINESDDAEENPLTCGDSEETSTDGFTFELFAEADYPDGTPLATGQTGDDGTGTLIFADLPLGTYVIVETGNELGLECEIVSVEGGTLNDDGSITVTLTADAANVVLTVVNDCEQPGEEEQFGEIEVRKSAADDPAAEFIFSATWDMDGFTLTDGDAEFSGDLPAGEEFTVTEELTDEQIAAGWSLADIDCGDAAVTVEGSSVTITVVANTTITCTFTNELEEEEEEGDLEIIKIFCPTEGDDAIFVFGPLSPEPLQTQGEELPDDEGCTLGAPSAEALGATFTITGGDLAEPLVVMTTWDEILTLGLAPGSYHIVESGTGLEADFEIVADGDTAVVVFNFLGEEEEEGNLKILKFFCDGEGDVVFTIADGDAELGDVDLPDNCENPTAGNAEFTLNDGESDSAVFELGTDGARLIPLTVGSYTLTEVDPNEATSEEFDVTAGETTTVIVFDFEAGGEGPGGEGPGGEGPGGEGTLGGNPTVPNTAMDLGTTGTLPAAILALLMLSGLGAAAYAANAEARRRS